MRAVRSIDGTFAVVDVDEPADGDGGIVVDIASAGICGSDLHMAPFGIPVTFGHECAGTLADGTPVAVQPLVHCGTCDRCRAGEATQCRTAGGSLYGIVRDGGMADRMAIDASCVVPLPDGLSVADACLVEPVAVAVHAVNGLEVAVGHRALVIGGGMIGLAAVAAAHAAGADVDLSARHPHQKAAGEQLGAGTDPVGEYDVVVDAVGTSESLSTAIAHARPAGAVAVPGTPWEGLTIADPMAWFMKELRIKPSFTYGHHGGVRETDQAAALLAATPDQASTVVTHRFALDDAPEAFRVAADRKAGAIKVVLEP